MSYLLTKDKRTYKLRMYKGKEIRTWVEQVPEAVGDTVHQEEDIVPAGQAADIGSAAVEAADVQEAAAE